MKTEVEVTFRVTVEPGAGLTEREAFAVDNIISLVQQVKSIADTASRHDAVTRRIRFVRPGPRSVPWDRERMCTCGKAFWNRRQWGQHKRRCQLAKLNEELSSDTPSGAGEPVNAAGIACLKGEGSSNGYDAVKAQGIEEITNASR